MPFRLGSSTPNASQARRVPSGDHAPPQKVSGAGSDGGIVRSMRDSGSMMCAAPPSSQQKIWISVPSGDQPRSAEGPAEPDGSGRSWDPRYRWRNTSDPTPSRLRRSSFAISSASSVPRFGSTRVDSHDRPSRLSQCRRRCRDRVVLASPREELPSRCEGQSEPVNTRSRSRPDPAVVDGTPQMCSIRR